MASLDVQADYRNAGWSVPNVFSVDDKLTVAK
jgi:hypothetical protein